ncbi:zinc-binding dehydrogenase [Paenibacillus polymyxa]|uniref:zinc-binding dehydrogenase n=1 Tax=Paenibacillus polymyxa TaxID=1406 RepID=UPI00296F843D|nr:zinc-binding dehydrogenase [Paenibacillus polymyxa]WOZ40813.1 zinc-binding dehydrogenase [Paenibacillus polymyxa]
MNARFFQAKPNRADFEAIVRQIQKNKLNIHIDKTYPFTAQGLLQAYRKSEELQKRGKIVISKNMG